MALIVVIGGIVGFIGNKMEWHWPALEDAAKPSVAIDDINTQVRYQSPDWVTHLNIDGDAAPTIELQVSFRNKTGHTANDVVLNLEFSDKVAPVPGSARLKNAANPNGLIVSDSLTGEGMNVGTYTNESTAYVKVLFTLKPGDVPCGQTTLPFRSYVRINDMNMRNATNSAEAVVVYNRRCDKV